MRELYATELRSPTATNGDAIPYIDAWTRQHRDRPGSDGATVTVHECGDTSRIITMQQVDEGSNLRWLSQVSLGPILERLHVTVRIQIGSISASVVSPLDYEFGTPAIVRTLLRQLDVKDGSLRVAADPGPAIGPSAVPELILDLEKPDRTLPIVIVSRVEPSGTTNLDAKQLHRELAGLAHVRVLSSSAASWALTNELGADRSVWGGAVRIYFPGLNRTEEMRRHRITFPDKVDASTIGRMRSWLGSLSAATTPEHPAIALRRHERHAQALGAATSANFDELRKYIELLEVDNEETRRTAEDYKVRATQLLSQFAEKEAELEQVRENFVELQRSLDTGDARTDLFDGDPATIAAAIDAVEELARSTYYRSKVKLAKSAVKSGRRFAHYARPGELLSACQAVLEAGALYHEGRLGVSPGEFFKLRGFGYGALPSPHLKVDDATSHDQCLRIYWDVDNESRMWTIATIGEHA